MDIGKLISSLIDTSLYLLLHSFPFAFVLFGFCAFVLWAPEDSLLPLGLDVIRNSYRTFLGIGIAVSSLLLIYHLARGSWWLFDLLMLDNIGEARRQRQMKQFLKEELNGIQRLILFTYLDKRATRLMFPGTSEDVSRLVREGFLKRGFVTDIDGFQTFSIDPWAFEFLDKNRYLLYSTDEEHSALKEHSKQISSRTYF